MMLRLGLMVEKEKTTLFRVTTGEIITSDKKAIQKYLVDHENEYTLQVF